MKGVVLIVLAVKLLMAIDIKGSGGKNYVLAAFTEGDQDYPQQEVCKNRKALRRILPADLSGKPITIWSLVKVTEMPKPYSPDLPTEKNVCSAFTFIEGCQMMRYTVTGYTPKDQKIQTVAYRETTENILVFDRTITLMDEHYEVFSSEVDKMTIYNADQTEGLEEAVIPESMNKINGKPILYAFVDRHPQDKWRLFQMCDRDVAWVAVPTEEATKTGLEKYMKDYGLEINTHLEALNVDMTVMVDIHGITFPFEPRNQSQPYQFK